MEGLLSCEQLRDVLSYCTETGIFTWKQSRTPVKAGQQAGGISGSGYRRIVIDGRAYQASHLAWLYVHGKWPPAVEMDHKDGDTLNDRIDNLRPATSSQNSANTRKPITNTSGYKGVTWNRRVGKWQSQIKVGGRSIYLGIYGNAEDAHAAYVAISRELRGDFARVA